MNYPKLKGYQFERPLGEGVSGEVWLAKHEALDEYRAVKLLRKNEWSDQRVEDLVQEGKSVASLPKHPNRIMVHDLIRGTTNCFLIMEFVEGETLFERTSAQDPMPWEFATRYALDVARGLADLHDRGMVHRDIKPNNILWDAAQDRAVLGDFGLAVIADQAEDVGGTFAFMAPEVKAKEAASEKSDIYSLAATLCYLVAGHLPTAGQDWPILLSDLQIPQEMRNLLRQCLCDAPAGRPDLARFKSLLSLARWETLAAKTTAKSDPRETHFQLDVTVSRAKAVEPDKFLPVTIPETDFVTSDLVQIVTQVNVPGHLTILVLSASGELQVIYPNASSLDNRVTSGQPLSLVLSLVPPSGTDTFLVIWSRKKVEGSPTQWRQWLEARPRNVRGVEVIRAEKSELPADRWAAKSIPISHVQP